MFQYAYDSFLGVKIVCNTEPQTLEESQKLWDKYYPDCLRKLKEGEKPQMCLWIDCKDNTNYHTVEKEIDYRDDYEIIKGEYYKVEKNKTKII